MDRLGGSSQDPCSALSPAAPRGGDGLPPDTEHLCAVGLPGGHTWSAVTAPCLGTSCWCPDPPPWFPTNSCCNLLANFMKRSLSSQSLALAFIPLFVLFFLEQVFVEHLLFARPCTSHCGRNAGPTEVVLLSWSLQSSRGDKQRQHKNKQGRMVPNVRSTMK